MGLTLSFITTDSSTIILDALKDDDYDLFEDNIIKEADFSLHLKPIDLQILSLCASEFNAGPSLNLRKQMTPLLDQNDKGLFSVDSKWVFYMSAVPMEKSKILCARWFEEMNRKYPKENMMLTEEAIEAVENLISICQFCINNKKELFHYWLL